MAKSCSPTGEANRLLLLPPLCPPPTASLLLAAPRARYVYVPLNGKDRPCALLRNPLAVTSSSTAFCCSVQEGFRLALQQQRSSSSYNCRELSTRAAGYQIAHPFLQQRPGIDGSTRQRVAKQKCKLTVDP